ncbi:hypothetical protein [Streptomyces sp. NEAU-NA10]|uniref:hypothetical protein n=1 Tax=Streptomyces sp. NEAU-NA10 TaxID=3416050 RepID=UPI003CC5E52E
MSETEELRRRIDALEAETDALREQITTTRAVVAVYDRDVAEFRTELRAHGRVLQVLRETQIEQGQDIAQLRTAMSNGFAEADEKFALVLAGIQAIADRLPEAPADASGS